MIVKDFYVEDDLAERVDIYLASEVQELSRTYIQSLIKEKKILVNSKPTKSRYLLKKGDHIRLEFEREEDLEISPEDIDLDIIYEDQDIAIINKELDMVVHPAVGNYSGTLVNALLYRLDSLSTYNGDLRPGIVHRLDKDTSGIILVAKNNQAHKILGEQFKSREVKREYIALVEGVLKDDTGIIDYPIGRNPKDRKKMAVVEKNSKRAITKYQVIERFSESTFLKLDLITGRTHQIRVHLSYINHPILGDRVYGNKKNKYKLEGQLLHAKKIGFIHPRTGEYMEFETDIPDRFKLVLEKIKLIR